MAIKGINSEIDMFVEEYKPFIASCTENLTGHYVRYGSDDELSIAMLAFIESIDSFDESRGNFLPFARNVIKRRLIDYFRKEENNRRHNILTVLDADMESEGSDREMDIADGASWDQYHNEIINEYRRMEIEELGKELKEWGISFTDLVRVSPKHEKTRKICKGIILFLLARHDLLEQIKERKVLPVSEIWSNLDVPRKIIERSRKYIISAILIKTGDYEYLSDFIKF